MVSSSVGLAVAGGGVSLGCVAEVSREGKGLHKEKWEGIGSGLGI